MSKMNELSQVLDELVSCGERLIQTANAVRECFSGGTSPETSADEETAAPEPAEPAYSREQVRALLADKAKESGGQFKTQVKALVKKYGNGGSFADVPAESYPSLVKEVEGLTDG